jgi:hypothetical protein
MAVIRQFEIGVIRWQALSDLPSPPCFDFFFVSSLAQVSVDSSCLWCLRTPTARSLFSPFAGRRESRMNASRTLSTDSSSESSFIQTHHLQSHPRSTSLNLQIQRKSDFYLEHPSVSPLTKFQLFILFLHQEKNRSRFVD